MYLLVCTPCTFTAVNHMRAQPRILSQLRTSHLNPYSQRVAYLSVEPFFC